MRKNPFKDLNIRTGVVRLSDFAFLLAADPKKEKAEIAHTLVYIWDREKFYEGEANFDADSCCIIQEPELGRIITAGSGSYSVQTRGDVISGNIFNNSHPKPVKPRYGEIRSVSEIGGKAHAVGSCGMVYRLDNLSDWTRIDEGLSDNFNARAIHGFGTSDLYAAGGKGKIRHYDGTNWSKVDNLTDENLTCVKCIQNETVYIGGYKGTLIQAKKGNWKLLNNKNMTDDIWDLEWFDGDLYVSTMNCLYRLEGDELCKVDFGNDIPATTYHLSSIEDILWSIGRKDVMEYNGKTWRRIV